MYKNILYFLKEFKDKSFKELPFCEADALILSQISYLNIEKFMPDYDKEYYLKDFVNAKNKFELSKLTMTYKDNLKLCEVFELTNRYNDIYVKHPRYILNSKQSRQFFGVTFFFKDFLVVAYRGTDLSLAGWKEDFNMMFLDHVPSQIDSLAYIDEITERYEDKKIILVGHSKGGNLVLYAGTNSKKYVKDRIIKIYDFDGPGFSNNDIYYSKEFKEIEDKLITYSSKTSIVAMLLYHQDDIVYLKSRGFSIFQHSPYNWKINNDGSLLRIERNTSFSRMFSRANTIYMNNTNKIERKRMVKIVFKILEKDPDTNLFELKKHPIKYLKFILSQKRLLTFFERCVYKLEMRKMRRAFVIAMLYQIN